MTTDHRPSEGSGAVLLAAYRPDPTLFRIQLESIRDQTRRDFRCLIGADSGEQEIRRLVEEIVGDDDRFEVIGWSDNIGFYLNFERLLASVPEHVAWVALSDQDDRWHRDKLERLVPLLDDAVLATGQARVVDWPADVEMFPSTNRREVAPNDLLFENQVTGSISVLRRDLLDVALPFPRLNTVTQLHDHWLALCASAVQRYVVLDEVVQDYIQHAGNLVGEVAAHRRWTPIGFVRRIVEISDAYEGGHDLRRCARACQVQSFGWRRTVTMTLAERVEPLPHGLQRSRERFALSSSGWAALSELWRATRSPDTSPWVVLTFLPGIPAELISRGAQRRAGRSQLRRVRGGCGGRWAGYGERTVPVDEVEGTQP